MGCWDEFCVICGGPPYAPDGESPIFTEQGESKELLHSRDFQWLDKYVGITETEELIPLGGYSGYGSFSLPNSSEYFTGFKHPPSTPPCPRGIFCHERCLRLLQRDLGYTLRFHDMEPLLRESSDDFWVSHLAGYTDYGGMEAYHGQEFDFDKALEDGQERMLRDPMECRENAERILGVWRPIVASAFKVERRSRGESGVHVEESDGMHVDAEVIRCL